MPETYHLTKHGTKWPNCLVCGSEDTGIVPKTGEWSCGDCGHQWHSDETIIETGDAATIGDHIEGMLHSLADESPAAIDLMARDRGVGPYDTGTDRSGGQP